MRKLQKRPFQALNSIGRSQPSKIMLVLTSSSAPNAPPPPTLATSSIDTLVLEWEPPVRDNGSEVDYFTLEMEDRDCNKKNEDYHVDISSVTSTKRRPKGGSMKGDSGCEWKQIYILVLLTGSTFFFSMLVPCLVVLQGAETYFLIYVHE